MIADMLSNKKLNLIVTELFIRGRKFSLDFIAQSYFAVTKNIRLNSFHYFLQKFLKNKKLQEIEFNNYSDFEFKNFLSFHKK